MIGEIFNKTNLLFLLDGIKLTLLIAIATIIISSILGTILAVLKNYDKGFATQESRNDQDKKQWLKVWKEKKFEKISIT